jgi:hypothetical protein
MPEEVDVLHGRIEEDSRIAGPDCDIARDRTVIRYNKIPPERVEPELGSVHLPGEMAKIEVDPAGGEMYPGRQRDIRCPEIMILERAGDEAM